MRWEGGDCVSKAVGPELWAGSVASPASAPSRHLFWPRWGRSDHVVTSERQGWLAGMGRGKGGSGRDERGQGQGSLVWAPHPPPPLGPASCHLPIWTTFQKPLLPPTDQLCPRGKFSRQRAPGRVLAAGGALFIDETSYLGFPAFQQVRMRPATLCKRTQLFP